MLSDLDPRFGESERESRWLDLPAVLQTVEVLSDPSDVGSFGAGRRVLDARLDTSLRALLEVDPDRVVEPAEFSLGVLDAVGEVGVLGEPSVAEPGVGFEFGDAVFGSGDPAIEVLDGWLAVGDPVPFGLGLGSSR